MPNPLKIEDSIEIAKSVDKVYAIYMDTDNIPKVVDGVVRVERLSDTRSRWSWERGGLSWTEEMELVSTKPNERAEWKTGGELFTCKAVTEFHEVDGDRTRVVHRNEYVPRVGGDIASLAGSTPLGPIVDEAKHVLKATLRKAKQYIEANGG
ncbi:SRPBCC family protein [Streptomyces sp. NPDC053048]|uniref:SRPBCC family protein n=1 Tax=Streptomyces sp. NPDC053048 TaxID=3365694 RepID=UPI0037D092D7